MVRKIKFLRHNLRFSPAGTSFQPRTATYEFKLHQEYLNEALKSRVKAILASESLNLSRPRGPGRNSKGKARYSKFKNVDVRGFLKSVELDDKGIKVQCGISPSGSIRVDEILKLLKLDAGKLAAPIRRTNIQWKIVNRK